MNKEQIYDEKIAPLVTEIASLCAVHGIAMLASFSIPTEDEDDLMCTTVTNDEEGRRPPEYTKAAHIIYGHTPPPMMITTTNKDGSKTLTAVLG